MTISHASPRLSTYIRLPCARGGGGGEHCICSLLPLTPALSGVISTGNTRIASPIIQLAPWPFPRLRARADPC
jgi:hypothetical protein